MKIRFVLLAAIAGVTVAGCAEDVPVVRESDIEITGAYAARVPGKWALYIDNSNLAKEHDEDETFCPTYTWTVALDKPMRQTIASAFGRLADGVVVVDQMPTAQSLRASGLAGVISIRGDDFRIGATTENDLISSTAIATAEIEARIDVAGAHGELVAEQATGSGRGVSDSGIICENNGDAIGTAVQGAMRDVVRRLGVQFASAPQLRGLPNPSGL